jgi:hypothetical protein
LIFASQTKLNNHAEICPVTLRCDSCKGLFPNEESLAVHSKICFSYTDCACHTTDERGNVPHLASYGHAIYNCWLCAAPMHTQTLLIKHFETAKCPQLPDPSLLVQILGKWWYSTLYMDIDIHAQIRQGRLDMKEMMAWIKEGALHPYICRGDRCDKTFGRFSSLVFHIESSSCSWDVERLRLDMLEKEVLRNFGRNVAM